MSLDTWLPLSNIRQTILLWTLQTRSSVKSLNQFQNVFSKIGPPNSSTAGTSTSICRTTAELPSSPSGWELLFLDKNRSTSSPRLFISQPSTEPPTPRDWLRQHNYSGCWFASFNPLHFRILQKAGESSRTCTQWSLEQPKTITNCSTDYRRAKKDYIYLPFIATYLGGCYIHL